jgi:hypothetical protein
MSVFKVVVHIPPVRWTLIAVSYVAGPSPTQMDRILK